MSEFSFPPNTNSSKKTQFSSLLLSDLFLFCSFILSHPLYFSYLIFFSPYIVKILSFLSPLFITTFLLLLALFTTLVNNEKNSISTESSELKVGFLLTTYHNVLVRLSRSNAGDEDQEFQQFEELEAYKIVFEASSTVELLEQEAVDKYPSDESYVSADQGLISSDDVNESLAEIVQSETGGKRLEGLLKENDDDESVHEKEEKEVKALSCAESNKGEELSMKSGSKAKGSKINKVKVSNADHNGVVEYLSKVRSNSRRLDNGGVVEYSSNFMENSQPVESNSSLGSFGSMRKDKEWKRTLACKLFEERHSSVIVDGGGGGAERMDLLWETYDHETDSNKKLSKTKSKKGGYEDHDDDDDDDEELDNGQLCCLQALKFSAGKMNLGMGRPNLVKISKAIKGFGWLHHVTKHATKKVHP
ncbi:hypothetical protein JRO89_XS01G0050200 [Xanthoceras sorbifolium]|uniref:Transmembrane protein n=1 Tax=Xanthoceras sorbifolium TaxID=99658 RepID=A0ABQ8IIQ8_9ROSI|nr:hypothetical protein JRO89_XS01G0050200 [Xanthoceras sorbifolium]